MELQEGEDYVVVAGEVVIAEHISTAGKVVRPTLDDDGKITAVHLVPTTGTNSNNAYRVGEPRTARQDGCHTNVGRCSLLD